jgi:hypothetical protein
MINPNHPPNRGRIPTQRGQSSPELDRLLRHRRLVATDVMRRLSHQIPSTFEAIVAIECAIAADWPLVYATQAQAWLVMDAAQIHNPDVMLMPGCWYCEAAGTTSPAALPGSPERWAK